MTPAFTPGGQSQVTTSLADETATLSLGAQLASVLSPGLKLYVSGDLGAGKTTLARGLLRALGYRGRVKSPTFTLVELYKFSNLCLYHFDFYRFDSPDEWEDAGFREVFGSDAVCLVEWPEKAAAALPTPDLKIRLEHTGRGRLARIEAMTEAGRRCVEQLSQ
jgi:tRNA threonylcarbamoyladenosine biosynthesis protein TsaE